MSEMLEDVSDGAVAQDRSTGPDNCVRMYMEADYTIFQNKGSVAAATTYIESFFSQVALLYANESVNMVLNELLVWDVADPYTGPSSSNYLYQFRDALAGVYNGDLAHLVGFTGGGGIAYVDVLCNSYYGVGYSGINTTYSNVPTYSWTVEVVTHEIGHNLGSQHTHACAWNGNNTAIDGCGPAAGYSEGCNAALPTAGTIMSYCHLVSGVGIDLNLGFGPQPGDRIRNEVYNAACLAACGGGGPCSYGPVNSQNFDGGWGIWTDGGTDCARINSATYANSGTYSIRLRDNTGTSLMSTTSQNWTAYEEITVEFSFITVSFDNSNEDFWLQLSNNGGSSYTTVGDWNYSVQFTNNVRGTATVVIPGPFASNSRLRIRADASADDDQVYIDDVVITGCSSAALAPNNGQSAESRLDDSAIPVANIDGVQISPNPARDVLNIRYTIDADALVQLQLTDLTGKTVWFQDGLVQAGEQSVRLELNTLPAGLYVFNLVHRDQVYSQKVVVTR
ncbi:MAG: T9SS type A sorting domain-containing protein [Saprospirales bacterium]|nr:T9SS type A sorting domain-containing protein [Saprospirales bacterium]